MEEKLERVNKLPPFHRGYVDDMFAFVLDSSAADSFLTTLNDAHPSINFTMKIATNSKLLFVRIEIFTTDHHLETSMCKNKSNKGLLYRGIL